MIKLAPVCTAIRLLQKPVTLIRHDQGSYIKGQWKDGEKQEISIKAHICEVTNNDLQRMPEGQRSEATHIIWTMSDLRPADEDKQTIADQIINHRGQTFTVIYVSNRDEAGFTRAVGTLLHDRERHL